MKFTKILMVFLTIASILNIYVFFKRDSFSYVKQSSYYELYQNSKNLSINSFNLVNDSTLFIKLNNKTLAPFNWLISNNKSYIHLKSSEPTITLNEGVWDYTLKSLKIKDSLVLKIEYYPDSFFLNQNSDERNRITIFRSLLPEKEIQNKLERWKHNKIQINDNELIGLKHVLLNQIKIKPLDNNFTKAQKIAQYLCFYISNSKGSPSIKTKHLSVYEQYLSALDHNKIDCGIYANIFSLFASQAGITNRIVEMKHNYGTFNDNIHVFNEYYIDEQQKWATTDIMLNNIAYINSEGELLNAVQLNNTSIANNSVSVLKSRTNLASPDSLIKIPFSNLSQDFFYYYYYDRDLHFYYNTNLKEVYSNVEKAKRYFGKNVWEEFYSDVKIVDNKMFYIKQLFFYFFLFFLFITIVTYFIEKTHIREK